jgi:hypothetical protein
MVLTVKESSSPLNEFLAEKFVTAQKINFQKANFDVG